jgi:histidine ammonia-lyase
MKNPERRTFSYQIGARRTVVDDVINVARTPRIELTLSKSARERMKRSRGWIDERIRDDSEMIYGVNTGFGSKASVRIDGMDVEMLQENLIRSHAAGTGDPFDVEVVRAAMFLLACSLARGHSGVRPLLVETLMKMLNAGIVPRIPEQGSLGASGDLAPLAHLALSFTCENTKDHGSQEVFVFEAEENAWNVRPVDKALERAGIPCIRLGAKEGLALINGTHFSTALTCLALWESLTLAKTADIVAAASLEALRGHAAAFDPRIHDIRPHGGQVATAANVRGLTSGSGLLGSVKGKVQDAYSLRCIPQVHGSVKDCIRAVHGIVEVEINSVTDNPVILSRQGSSMEALSGGNFHAEPLALACDILAISISDLGSISERRINRLMDSRTSEGLPSFLARQDGLESGLMMGHYTAASLASENKALSHPASVDSIPVSEQQEDHVSMAPVAGRKARRITRNVAQILAIELLCACQALDQRRENSEGKPGRGIELAYSALREQVEPMTGDREISSDMEKALDLIGSGRFLAWIEEGLGREMLMGSEPEKETE